MIRRASLRRRLLALAAAALLAPGAANAALSCGTGASTLDWDQGAVGWTAGALSGSYTVGGEPMGVAFTGATNRLINIFSQQTPFKSIDVTGGLVPAQQNLLFVVNYTNTGETLTLTITAGTPGQGVGEIEFTLFDVDTDRAAAPFNFQDRITVTGTLGGVGVGNPTFTTSVSNTAAGNVATGVNASANDSGDANLTIKFSTAVDQIVIVYQAGPNSIADPAQQGMGLHDIGFCPVNTDYGDAPAAYGAPAHKIVAGVALGAGAPDAEIAAQPGAGANGDDTAGTDDENGAAIPALVRSIASTVSATVQGAGGFLQAWFDWNGDGDFADAGEQAATNLQDGGVGDTNAAAGAISFVVTPPGTATTSGTFARFRWSTTSGLGPTGGAANGEVEDYAVTVSATAPPSCPAGQLLINQVGNATAALVGTGVANSANALGALSPAGTTPPDAASAEINDTTDTLTLDLGALVPQNATITLSAARDGGMQGNSARLTIEFSPDNVTYMAGGTYGTAVATYPSLAQDVLERNGVLVASGGARYVRFRTVDGDDIFVDGVEYAQVCIASATLTAQKTVAVYDPSSAGLFAIPGNDVVYTIAVANAGTGAADANSVFIVDTLPAEIEFFNGDMDGAGPATGAAFFTQSGGAGLTFTLATDLLYSNAALRPASLAACTYAPIAGYDPAVRHVCFNPKGAMAAGDPDPAFSVQFRARIK